MQGCVEQYPPIIYNCRKQPFFLMHIVGRATSWQTVKKCSCVHFPSISRLGYFHIFHQQGNHVFKTDAMHRSNT